MHALRLRLTLLYAGVLAAATGILLALSWWLLHGHLERTLPAGYADGVMGQVAWQYALATAGLVMVAAGAGWLLAGPLLARVQGAVERQQRFVANASHELRTPLTVIRTEADVTLADPDASVQELRAMGRVIIEATDRTEELLDGLLVLATASHGARADEPVELAALTRRVVASSQGHAARARVRFDVETVPAWVRGDRALLERLVGNLVENAIRHGAGCRAAIRVRGGGTAVVEVANGGAVIAPELLARLGEPFQRLDRHRSDRGSGLGLSIVRAVAEAHGGGLELQAPAGGGLRARVTLPGAGVGAGAVAGGVPAARHR
jgi:signal transduction histidine kinase